MPDIVLYFIKVNIALALFYAAYRLFLYRLTFYNLNRFYLLFGLMFSAMYPLVDLSRLWISEPVSIPVSTGTIVMDWQLPQEESLASVWLYVIVLAVTVMFMLAVRMLVRLISLWRIHRRSRPAVRLSVRYRETQDPVSPFSFWKRIYVHTSRHGDQELTAIFRHEQEHVRQLHSLDVLMAEAASVICWYNPFIWLYRRAVGENLEFIADRKVIEHGADTRSYQYHLIHTLTQCQPHLTNSFNFKSLKNRMMMMNKKRSARYNLGKYLLIVPVIVLFVSAFTVTRAYQEEKVIETVRGSIAVDAGSSLKADTGRKKDEGNLVVVTGRLGRTGSQKGKSPLYIIDGKEVKESEFRSVKPEDIERIEVFKDSKALARYGKKGENGVVVVTLKGSSEKSGPLNSLELTPGERISNDKVMYDDASLRPKAAPDSPVTFFHKKSITLTHENPLIILDGKEIDKHVLSLLDKEQIESISILKEQGGEAIYGSKGINGVILITSKKGEEDPHKP